MCVRRNPYAPIAGPYRGFLFYMAKDPAFLFYSSDFLAGVSDLTFEERGQYITLLCLHHQKGRLSEKMIRLTIGNATADVMAKFRQDENGLFFNDRLEEEIEKRRKHAEKQRVRAIDGWKKRKTGNATSNATADATALPLENENENGNEDVNKSVTVNKEKPKNLNEPLNEIELAGTAEFVFRMTKKEIAPHDIESYWQAFLLASEGELYPGRNKQVTHFRHWLKNEMSKQHKPTKQTLADKWDEWEKRKGIKQ